MSEPIDYKQLAGFLFPTGETTWIDKTLKAFIEHPTLFQEVAKKMGYYSNEYFQKARDEGWDACEQSLQSKLSQAEERVK